MAATLKNKKTDDLDIFKERMKTMKLHGIEWNEITKVRLGKNKRQVEQSYFNKNQNRIMIMQKENPDIETDGNVHSLQMWRK